MSHTRLMISVCDYFLGATMKGKKINGLGHDEYVCTKCGKTLPISEFGFTSIKTGSNKKYRYRRSDCKNCRNLKKRQAYEKTKSIDNDASSGYRKNLINP